MGEHNIIECGGFYFIHNFDSGNLGNVEQVPTELIVQPASQKSNNSDTIDYEFNIWTRPDCAGTEFENGNRTWFYFGIQPVVAHALVRLNIINLNKQGKMFNQGMAPVTRTLPGKPQWERIRDRPVHYTDDNTFNLSFKYRTADNIKATTFFAFTYPYSFAELQIALNSIDSRLLPLSQNPSSLDEIYYCRECLIYSLDGRRVDLLTISSYHGITTDREPRLANLFPERQERPFKFRNKKIIFVSARVHPGETPASFVFNGFLNLLLTRNDPIAVQLRKLYVFKMIPILNPDGVARGHYRTDTRGVNLNRVYLNPSLEHHPTIYASRSLIRYYHYGCEKEDDGDDSKSLFSRSMQNINESSEIIDVTTKKKSPILSKSELEKSSVREKYSKASTMRSGPTIKAPSVDSHKERCAEAATLIEQVVGMKLNEMPSETSGTSYNRLEESSSILNDQVLQTCLGSSVHLSTSEELNLQGSNPLKPLRDALKNSISLLMDSGSGECGPSEKERYGNIKMDWCRDCRRSVSKMEDSMPGSARMVPGYSALHATRPTYNNIEEYREHQKQQFDYQNAMMDSQGNVNEESVYFCTNCFKKYIISEQNEEVRVVDVVSGDSGSLHEQPSTPVVSSSTGDAALDVDKLPSQPSKEEKPKTKPSALKKKPPPQPNNNTTTIKPQNNNNTAIKPYKEPESGLFLYMDLHGHASKKGIFMYGNHFDDLESSVECMLLPRIMSLNNLHFHFSSCNFTERNMYLKDRRDGMSREGSGRVAVFKATGLVRCYTLECNYNTGRLVNVLPPGVRDGPSAQPITSGQPTPPKYTPHLYEEVGRSLGASILDLTGQHPNSRIPCSEHRSLGALRDWLRAHTRTMRPQLTMSRLRPKTASPPRVPLYLPRKGKVTEERKENTYVGAKSDTERKQCPPVFAQRSSHEIMSMNMKFAKKNEPVKSSSKTRYLGENEPKPKTLSNKRRNVLAIRKPNSSKTQVSGVVKVKISRRSVDDSDARSLISSKISKRVFCRSIRGSVTRSSNRGTAAPSSSSEDIVSTWEEVAGGTVLGTQGSQTDSVASKRRPFPNPSPSRLKKIRLKTGL